MSAARGAGDSILLVLNSRLHLGGMCNGGSANINSPVLIAIEKGDKPLNNYKGPEESIQQRVMMRSWVAMGFREAFLEWDARTVLQAPFQSDGLLWEWHVSPCSLLR